MPRSLRLALVPLIAAFAALSMAMLASPKAQAGVINGIADENLEEWSAPTWAAFDATGVKLVRHIVRWDVAIRDANGNPLYPGELWEAQAWIGAAEARGLEILISFGTNWGGWPPAAGSYRKGITAFREQFPQIRYYTAWNEPNHILENNGYALNPTWNPQLAADYWASLAGSCWIEPTCTVIAGDFNETSNMASYMDDYKARLAQIGISPTIWGVHPYNAVRTSNRTRLDGFMSRTEGKPVWFTEVGGMICDQGPGGGLVGGSYPAAEAHQASAAQYLNNLIYHYGTAKVQRTYYYAFSMPNGTQAPCGGGNNVFDSNLLGGGETPRPAFDVVFPGTVLAPRAETLGGSAIQTTQTQASANIEPRSFHTQYSIEYGTSTAYGSKTASAYAGYTGTTTRTRTITGLAPETTYHYRAVANNAGGVGYGEDKTFTTEPVPRESDVNGDGRSDLVALHTNGYAYTYAGQASGYIGAAVGSLGGTMDLAQADGTGHYPVDVDDVNGDGYDDLVTMHSSGTVYTYPGQANGSFAAAVTSLANGLAPAIRTPAPGQYEPIGVRDTNGDGRGDLVVYDSVGNTVYTYPGQVGGGFSGTRVGSLYGVADSAHFDSVGDYFVDVADVDGDKLGDLVAHGTNGDLKTYRATGSGGFEASVKLSALGVDPSLPDGSGYEPIAVADVNRDGYADFVMHNTSGTVSTYLGRDDGYFGTRVDTAGSFDSDLYDGTGSELGTVIDISGDGYADLVTAKRSDGNVYVLQGKADGSFGTATTNFAGAYASTRVNRKQGYQMAMEKPLRRRDGCRANGCGLYPKSDVNGDHRSDLVSLDTAGTVNAYRGQPTGIFASPVSSRNGELDPGQYDGSGYFPLGIDDVNGDGLDDLVSMHSSGTVYTFPGQANGSVAAAVTSLTGTLAPSVLYPGRGEFEPIGVGDTTGDRRADLVTFNNYNRTVYTYSGQASGGFSSVPVASLTLTSGTGNGDSALFDSIGDYFLDVADVTGDDLADLVALNTNGNGETYVASGSGGFGSTPVTSFAGAMNKSLATGGSEPVAVADVNGDGRADFVAHDGNAVSTYMGQANGSFTTRADTFGTFDSNLYDGTGSEYGTVVDVNGDGFGDLVWTKGDGKLYVQKGRRDGTFGSAQSEASGSYASTRHNRASGQQMVNEQPLRRRSACAWNGCGMDLRSDVNGDRRADLVTLEAGGSVYTYTGQASGEFAPGKSSSLILASGVNGVMDPAQYDGFGYYPLGVEDINGDRLDDLVTLDSEGTVTVYTGALDGSFSGAEIDSLWHELLPAVLAPTPGKYEPIGLGDATGDGRGDLVVFNNLDKIVYTFPGQASGTFSSTKVASLTLVSGTGMGDSALFDSAGDYFIDVADVTGDGLVDLVAQGTNGYGKTYKAIGGGGFSATPVNSFSGTMNTSLATGAGYEPVAVADVNGDGRADFVAHRANGTIYTYLGQANGSFTYQVTTPTPADSNLYDGEGSELATVIDVNGDGFADLISANRGDSKVYVQLGQREGNFGNAVARLSNYVSTRHSQATGQQIVTEQPLRRRSACAANGCH